MIFSYAHCSSTLTFLSFQNYCMLIPTCAHTLFAADPHVLSEMHSKMTEQELMEFFVAGLHDASRFQTPDGDFRAITEWDGVTCTPSGAVGAVEWEHLDGGQVDFSSLPPHIRSLIITASELEGSLYFEFIFVPLLVLDLASNRLSGSLLTHKIPESLLKLRVAANNFTGELDCTAFPAGLKSIDVGDNTLEGTLDLTELPPTLLGLRLSKNMFFGAVNISQLPKTLQMAWLCHGMLKNAAAAPRMGDMKQSLRIANQDSLPLGDLPDGMHSLSIKENIFSGTVALFDLPSKMQVLVLAKNHLSGSLELRSLPTTLTHLDLSHNHFVGRIDCLQLPEVLRLLDVQGNQLSGQVHIAPSRIKRRIILKDNRFSGDVVVGNVGVDFGGADVVEDPFDRSPFEE